MLKLDYTAMAQQVLAVLDKAGALEGFDQPARAELAKIYARCLAELVRRRVEEELARLGRRYEFQVILREEPGRAATYLSHIIPNYPAFLLEAVTRAQQQITGPA